MDLQFISQLTVLIEILFFFGFCIYKYTKQNHDYKL